MSFFNRQVFFKYVDIFLSQVRHKRLTILYFDQKRSAIQEQRMRRLGRTEMR